jgi:hypothetical protein
LRCMACLGRRKLGEIWNCKVGEYKYTKVCRYRRSI